MVAGDRHGAVIPRAYPSKFDRGRTHRVELDGAWVAAETMPETVIIRTGDGRVTGAAKAHAIAKLVDEVYGGLRDAGYLIPAAALPALVERFGDRVRYRTPADTVPQSRRPRRQPADLGDCQMCYAEPADHVSPSHGALCRDCDLGGWLP